MISKRAKGVVKIIAEWRRLNASTNGGNTAYDRALREANELAYELRNAEAMSKYNIMGA